MAATLWVYGDESGIEPSDPVCVVGGLLASPIQWDSFNEAWRRVLDRAGIREFHSREFFDRHYAKSSRKNPFADWPDVKAHRLLEGLLSVIRSHPHIRPIGTPMDVKDFFSFTWGERTFLTGGGWDRKLARFTNPPGAPTRTYHLPFFLMVGDPLQEAGPDDVKVHFVMDEQQVIQAGVQTLYSWSRNSELVRPDLRQKLGDLSPGLSEDHEGIQAADLLAYFWFSHYSRGAHFSGERADAFAQTPESWRELRVIQRRGMEEILSRNLSLKERAKVKAVKSPRERQPWREKKPRARIDSLDNE